MSRALSNREMEIFFFSQETKGEIFLNESFFYIYKEDGILFNFSETIFFLNGKKRNRVKDRSIAFKKRKSNLFALIYAIDREGLRRNHNSLMDG